MKNIKIVFLIAVLQLSACIGSSVNNKIIHQDSEAQRGAVFPQVSAADLDGKAYDLPRDFTYRYNILVFGFAHEQKEMVKAWLLPLNKVKAMHSDITIYRIPVIDPSNFALRTVIRNGMRSKAEDEARKQTLTLFVDRQSFADSLGIKGIDTVAVVVTDREGHLIWQQSGEFAEAKIKELDELVSIASRANGS